MDIKVEVKVKLDKGREIKLSHDEAKKLYEELKVLFNTQYIPSYPSIPYNVPSVWKEPFIYTTTDKTIPNFDPVTITCSASTITDFDEQKCLDSIKVKPERDVFEEAMMEEYK